MELAPRASTGSMDSPTIVLLRAPKGREDAYEKALSGGGFRVQFVPVLQFQFTNAQEITLALLDSSKYAGLILTSQTAVDSAIHALSDAASGWRDRLAEQWRELPVFVVGKATAQAVERLGLTPTGAVSGDAQKLSQIIIQHFASVPKPSLQPLLFPCGSTRRETLPSNLRQAGVALHCLDCYDTVADPGIEENLRRLAEQKAIGDSAWVVFFSPSGVQHALGHLKSVSAVDKLQFVAIGPTTAEALQEAGVIPSAVADKPTADSLLSAITEAHGARS